MWWLLFAAAASCLIAWAWTGRYRTAAALFVLAYVANLYRPRHMPAWHLSWLMATAVLLPLRIAMLAECALAVLRPLKELWLLVGAITAASTAAIVILIQFVPLEFDFYSLVAARQYAQIAMALWLGFLLLYEWLHGRRPNRHSLIVFVVLLDYAVAASFEDRSGLAAGFIISTAAIRATVKTASGIVLAFCFLWWAAVSYRAAKEIGRQDQ